MNIVLFLGAGFSAPFGLPTMNQFLEEVSRSDRITPEDREFIGQLVLEARRANSILESSPTNLEDILSFAVMGDRLGIQEDEEPRAPKVIKILHNIYSFPKKAGKAWKSLHSFEKLINADLSKLQSNLSIITTNYDLLAEFAAFSSGAFTTLPFEYQSLTPADNFPVLYYKNGIPLFKLHGSLNWHWIDEQPNICVDDRIVKFRNNHDTPDLLPISYDSKHQAPDTTLIVPPTFLKPDLPEALIITWAGAAQALQNAEIVIFIGYSFPPSDIEMKYFLAKCLADNSKLQKIRLFDLRADEISERLKSSSSGFGSHFKDFLEPQKIQNIGWTELSPLKYFKQAE